VRKSLELLEGSTKFRKFEENGI
jgi:hypothetical protein